MTRYVFRARWITLNMGGTEMVLEIIPRCRSDPIVDLVPVLPKGEAQ